MTYRVAIWAKTERAHHPILQCGLGWYKKPYNGKIYCVAVPSGVVLVRRNGKAMWCGNSHTFEDFIAETLTMLPYGWHYGEIVYKQRLGPEKDDPTQRSEFDDGRIGLRKIAPRSQDTLSRWDMQDDGGINGMWQIPPISGGEIYIPIERALLFRTTSRLNSPEGVSILRTAYESWYFLKRIREYEAIGIERELAGLPIVRIPAKYTKADASDAERALYNQFKQIARDLKFNEQGGLVLPSDMYLDKDGFPIPGARQVDVELLKSAGTRTIDTSVVKNDYKRDITRTVLADFLMLGQDKGAFNLGESKSDLFLKAIEAILDQIASPINRFAIPRLWAMNGLPRETMPKYIPATVTKADIAKLGAFLQQAAAAGMPLFPDEPLEAYIRSQADLPEKSPEALAAQAEEKQRALDAEDAALEAQNAAVANGMPPGGKPPGKGGPFGGKPGAKPPPFGAKPGAAKPGAPGAKKPPFAKFNEAHDEFGRFTFSDAGTSSPFGAEFVSPNVGNLTFDQAVAGQFGERHQYVVGVSKAVDEAMGLHSTTTSVVGAWADGAENSTLTVVEGAPWEDLKASAAMKGFIANQKQVLVFQEAAQGDSFLSSFRATGSLGEIHQRLLEGGLEFHTLEPSAGGATVHVFGQDEATAAAVTKVGEHYGEQVTTRVGHGEFLGTTKQDGSDEEQRADARKVYGGVISGSGSRRAGAAWDRLRDRYAGADAVKALLEKAYDEDEHPRDEHGRWTDGGGGGSRASPRRTPAQRSKLVARLKAKAAKIKKLAKRENLRKMMIKSAIVAGAVGAAGLGVGLIGLETQAVTVVSKLVLEHLGISAASGTMAVIASEALLTGTMRAAGLEPETAKKWLVKTLKKFTKRARNFVRSVRKAVGENDEFDIDPDFLDYIDDVVDELEALDTSTLDDSSDQRALPFSKFNERHDDLGRFAASDGGAPSRYAGLGEAELESEMSRLQKEALVEAPTGTEKDSVLLYTASEFETINKHLRGQAASPHLEDTVKNVAMLDSIIGKSKLAEPMVLYRQFGENTGERLRKLPVGSVFEDKSYVSASADTRGMDEFGNRAGVIEINVSKGHSALPTDGLSAQPGEFEVLLPRGSKFRVVRAQKGLQRMVIEPVHGNG